MIWFLLVVALKAVAVVASLALAAGLTLFGWRLVQVDPHRLADLSRRAGGFGNYLKGSAPIHSAGDRRFEMSAGPVLDLRTGLVLEAGRVSDEALEEALAR